MKITHIALNGPVTDNWTYQDNLLPKYHKKLGNDVSIITSKYIYDFKGNITIDERGNYVNDNGIKVVRLEIKNNRKLSYKFKKFINLYERIELENPDVLFIHGCQFIDIKTIVRYIKKQPTVKVYVDNHADFSNSATNWISKNILHKLIWRHYAHKIEPFTTKFYGVLPARVDFLKEIYKLPEEKLDLLIMGADDEKVIEAKKRDIKESIRYKLGINPSDFLIMTGGKIDLAKKQTLLLMQSVREIYREDVKLIVFGSVVEDIREEVERLVDGIKIQYIGWISAEESYKYFGASDLVIFPGRHSVFWEQVVGLGIPLVVKHWKGTTHVDIGGNCIFLYQESSDEIKHVIESLLKDRKKLNEMRLSAEKNKKNKFLYSKIAEKTLKE